MVAHITAFQQTHAFTHPVPHLQLALFFTAAVVDGRLANVKVPLAVVLATECL